MDAAVAAPNYYSATTRRCNRGFRLGPRWGLREGRRIVSVAVLECGVRLHVGSLRRVARMLRFARLAAPRAETPLSYIEGLIDQHAHHGEGDDAREHARVFEKRP